MYVCMYVHIYIHFYIHIYIYVYAGGWFKATERERAREKDPLRCEPGMETAPDDKARCPDGYHRDPNY